MDATEYAKRAGLTLQVGLVREAQQRLWDIMEGLKSASLPATPTALDRLYRYQVPRLSADGSCSLIDELDPTPYDLAAALGGRSANATLNLMALNALVEEVVRSSAADWVGVYQARAVSRGRALVKLAYRGLPSRAEFPLTEAFARTSNNSAVGLAGKAVLINDVQAHVVAGGGYYKCDPKVQSEACLPVFTEGGELVGIVDAEATYPGFFDEARLAQVVALALEVQARFP